MLLTCSINKFIYRNCRHYVWKHNSNQYNLGANEFIDTDPVHYTNNVTLGVLSNMSNLQSELIWFICQISSNWFTSTKQQKQQTSSKLINGKWKDCMADMEKYTYRWPEGAGTQLGRWQWWANPNHDWDLNRNLNTLGDSIWNMKIQFKRLRFDLK